MHLPRLLLTLDETGETGETGAAPAMCSVSEAGSTDPLVTRFRQVEETLEKLHRENKSLKNKVPRYNALCTLYHESAQQLKHLQLQLAAKEATIRELRGSLALARQQRQPQPPGGDAAGAEPARSLVESLLEQLGQARDRLRDSERLSARRVEALSQVRPGGRSITPRSSGARRGRGRCGNSVPRAAGNSRGHAGTGADSGAGAERCLSPSERCPLQPRVPKATRPPGSKGSAPCVQKGK